ncbi:hypothetical protein T265_06638 [Opisthorchis viverrini]|uniref:Uncharacterized protein n=1 Tax=Opisthorchis viverrini TaxID=6198 RepID=A0A074ZFU5_OPIVI|nr:hypothetical protein T265_06638 [Opisthorchis viverrini]KER26063.1 hypothetical protein T265_06638 [Opisthorchis viverrini]
MNHSLIVCLRTSQKRDPAGFQYGSQPRKGRSHHVGGLISHGFKTSRALRRATSIVRDAVTYGSVVPSMALVHPNYYLQCIAPFPIPPLNSALPPPIRSYLPRLPKSMVNGSVAARTTQPTMTVFLDSKVAFHSVNRQELCQSLWSKDVLHKSLTLLKTLYTKSRGRVEVYRKLSPHFTHHIKWCQAGLDTTKEDSLSGSNNCGIEMPPRRSLTDIEYADDRTLLGSDAVAISKYQTILIYGVACASHMQSVNCHCKVGWAPTLSLCLRMSRLW